MKKTIIELEDKVFDALEESASVQGTTLAALSVRIVKDYVHSYKIEKSREPLNKPPTRPFSLCDYAAIHGLIQTIPRVVGANQRLSDFPWIGAGRSKGDDPNRPVSVYHDEELEKVYGEKVRKMRDYMNDLRYSTTLSIRSGDGVSKLSGIS